MAIIRNNLRKKFSTIPNAVITDISLSHGAVRVFCYLATKHDEWEVNNSDIRKQLQIKDKGTLAKYWNELINNGWISRTKKKSEKGKFIGGFDYELHFDKKYTELGKNPPSEKPELGKNPPLNTTDLINTTDLEERNIKEIFLIIDERIENEILNKSLKISYYLYEKIMTFKPNFICRNIQTWQHSIILALEKDKRTFDELIGCIDYIYSEQGAFWRPNILSGKKLREKFDTIEMQLISQRANNKNTKSIEAINRAFEAEKMGVM